MQVNVATNLALFGYRLAESLEARGYGVKVQHVEPCEPELRIRSGMTSGAVGKLLSSLRPLVLAPVEVNDLDVDFEIRFACEFALGKQPLVFQAETPELLEYLSRDLASVFDLQVASSSQAVLQCSKLVTQGVQPVVRQILLWWLKQDGHPLFDEANPKQEPSASAVDTAFDLEEPPETCIIVKRYTRQSVSLSFSITLNMLNFCLIKLMMTQSSVVFSRP